MSSSGWHFEFLYQGELCRGFAVYGKFCAGQCGRSAVIMLFCFTSQKSLVKLFLKIGYIPCACITFVQNQKLVEITLEQMTA
jgi:hypothetical protein